MWLRLTLIFLIIVLLQALNVKSNEHQFSPSYLKIPSASRKIASGLRKRFWNVEGDTAFGSKGVKYNYHKLERKGSSGISDKEIICARHRTARRKRQSNQDNISQYIKMVPKKENTLGQIEKVLLCNYERVRRELKKINITLAPEDDLKTNFQIIIDSELAKAILRRLALLSTSTSSDKEIAISVSDSDMTVDSLDDQSNETDDMNENETKESESGENSLAVTEDNLSEDDMPNADDSTALSPEEEKGEFNLLPSSTSITTEEELDGNDSESKETNDNAETPLTCNLTAYQEIKEQCKGFDSAKEKEECLPCSILGSWISKSGGILLDIKAGNSRGALDVQVHDVTVPNKGFLSTSWKIVGQFPSSSKDGDSKTSNNEESMTEDSFSGIFTLTAAISESSSDTDKKQVAVFIGECLTCKEGEDIVEGKWILKQSTNSKGDIYLSMKEMRDVLKRDFLLKSIKSRRQINHQKKRAYRSMLKGFII